MSNKSKEPSTEIYGFARQEPIGVSQASSCDSSMMKGKRTAVKSYISALGPALQTKYGRSQHYSPKQVRSTAVESALSIDYICWAYMLFCTASDFNLIHSAAGEVCSYSVMRETVAAAFFGGNTGFDIAEVASAITSGTVGAITDGVLSGSEWLGHVDWSGILDWT